MLKYFLSFGFAQKSGVSKILYYFWKEAYSFQGFFYFICIIKHTGKSVLLGHILST